MWIKVFDVDIDIGSISKKSITQRETIKKITSNASG